jgi:putative transcriptional regulator
MTITHHPPEDLLADFATGALDEAEHLVVAVHASQCARCRRFVGAVEHLAGAGIEDAAPAPMSVGSFDNVMARIDALPKAAIRESDPPQVDQADADLPEILKRCRFGKTRRVAPGVSLRPILLPAPGKSRAFLLSSSPGTRMLEHTHTGEELTCVLKGSFSHQGGRYGPGDFDFGDDAVDHRPIVGGEEPCLCLVAMTGELKMHGFFGWLISPFVRL